MTAYNRESYIADAVNSVLASTHTDFEMIIVDDCSTDHTVDIARAFEVNDARIKVYKNEKNLGDYPNRNKAASYAKGKYLKYLDSDDVIYPWGLEAMVFCMEKFPDAGFGLIAKNMEVSSFYPLKLSGEQAYKAYFFHCALLTIAPSGSIIKRAFFESVGGFSGKPYIGDTEMWLKLAQQSSVVCMPLDLIWWRQHEQQQVQEGMGNAFYEKQTLIMHTAFLKDESCPLQRKDAAIALRNQRNIYTRKSIRFFLHFQFAKGINLIKNNRLNFIDFVYALKKKQRSQLKYLNEDFPLP